MGPPETLTGPSMRNTKPSDRRDSYRLELRPGLARVRVADGALGHIRDLSASGGSLLLRGLSVAGKGSIPAEIELDDGGVFRARIEVVRSRIHEPGVTELGARFDDLPRDALRTLSRFISRQFHKRSADPARLLSGKAPSLRVSNPAFITNLFRPRPVRPRIMLVIDGTERLDIQLAGQGLAFDGARRVVRASLAGDPACLVDGRSYTFVLTGAGAVVLFESRLVGRTGKDVFIAVPAEVRQTGFRGSPRVLLDEEQEIEVAFSHPRVSGALVRGPLFDVAGRGVSFPLDAEADGLFPGDRLEGLHIRLPGGEIEADGVIRNIGRRGDLTLSCGVELTAFANRAAAERWRQFVFRHVHPHLSDGIGPAAAVAWRVLERSRYVDLWTPDAERELVRREYVRTWTEATPDIGHTLLLRNGQEPVGISAGNLAYPGTWLLHHLGIDAREQARDLSRPLQHTCELIGGLVDRLRDTTEVEHVLVYVERGRRWNDRLFGDFALRYSDHRRLLLRPLHLFRFSAGITGETGQETSGGTVVVPATPHLWTLLSERLQAESTPLETEALAFDAAGIDMRSFSERCAGRGYLRRRQGLFALVNGLPVAALVAELGADGVNVFGLLDTCRIVVLDPASWSKSVAAALLEAGRTFYRSFGKRTFLLLQEGTEPDGTFLELGGVPVAPGLRWLAHRDVIPAWAAYLDDLLKASTRVSVVAPGRLAAGS